MRPLWAIVVVVSIDTARMTLETCIRECALPEQKRYCPVRSAPTQIFDGLDGVDVAFDLKHKSIKFTQCNQSNSSTLGLHWWSVAGQGYLAQGRTISALPDDPLRTGSHARLANLSLAHTATLSLMLLNTSRLFSYYGRQFDTFYVLASGAIGMGTTDIAAPPNTVNMERYLRSSYWPNMVVCALCNAAGLGSGSRIFYELAGRDTEDERLVVSFAPSSSSAQAYPQYQAALYLATNSIQLSWHNISLPNKSAVVGLSHGITPEWKALAYDALDLSETVGCESNPNCSVEEEVRPVGRTRPPATRNYPWAVAPPYNPHPQFCELGCSYYYTNWSLLGCRAECDDYFNYDITTGYSDRAEVARYECYDGCAIGNLRCQPGFYCFQGIMRSCPSGTYRDEDYFHVTHCDDCPHGRFREARGGRYLDSCDKCNLGRYNQHSGSASVKACILCPPGRFANEPGMARCKCIHHFDGFFERTSDSRVVYPECDAEDYLDETLRPEIETIDYSPRMTYP